MADSRTVLLVLLVGLSSFLAQVESQTVLVNPTTIAAGSNVNNAIMNCSVTNIGSRPTYVVWSYIRGSVEFEIFNSYYNETTVADPTNFAVNFFVTRDANNAPVQANAELTVRLAKPELASIYTCHLTPATAIKGSSSLIVLDAVECPSSMEYVEYPEGSVVNMSCSVNYYDKSTQPSTPILKFVRSDTGELIPGGVFIDETGRRTLRLNKTLRAEDDGLKYICRASYPNNNPTYSDNCSTVFHVLHSVTQVSFWPISSSENPVTIPVGETINAMANGRPPPTFAWYDEQDALIGKGGQLTVTEEMLSWAQPVTVFCRANNSIDGGVTFTAVTGNYTFNVTVGETAVSVHPTKGEYAVTNQGVDINSASANGRPPTTFAWISRIVQLLIAPGLLGLMQHFPSEI